MAKYSTKKGTRQRARAPFVSVKAYRKGSIVVRAHSRRSVIVKQRRASELASFALQRANYYGRINDHSRAALYKGRFIKIHAKANELARVLATKRQRATRW